MAKYIINWIDDDHNKKDFIVEADTIESAEVIWDADPDVMFHWTAEVLSIKEFEFMESGNISPDLLALVTKSAN